MFDEHYHIVSFDYGKFFCVHIQLLRSVTQLLKLVSVLKIGKLIFGHLEACCYHTCVGFIGSL